MGTLASDSINLKSIKDVVENVESAVQHIWNDEAGTHISEKAHEEGAVEGLNALINSRGLSIKNGDKVQSSISGNALELFDETGKKISRTGKKEVHSGNIFVGYATDRVLPLSYTKREWDDRLMQTEWVPCTPPVSGQTIMVWLTVVPNDWASPIRFLELKPSDYEFKPNREGTAYLFELQQSAIAAYNITAAHSCTVHLSYISTQPQDAFVMYNREYGYPVTVKSQEYDESYIYRGMGQLSSMWATYINADTIHARKIEGLYEETQSGGWTIRKYSDGEITASIVRTGRAAVTTSWGPARYADLGRTQLPLGLFDEVDDIRAEIEAPGGELFITRETSTNEYVGRIYACAFASYAACDYKLYITVKGRKLP